MKNQDELLKCRTRIIAVETDNEMQVSLFRKDTVEKDEQLRKLKNQLEDASRAKVCSGSHGRIPTASVSAWFEKYLVEEKRSEPSIGRSGKFGTSRRRRH